MKVSGIIGYSKIIITCFLAALAVFCLPFVSDAREEEAYAEVSSFDEFTSSLTQMMSTGGTVVLTSDITVPASESFTYTNGRYRKEVLIETGGHTIRVEGSLVLWPFLTVRGNDDQKELFHVYPGGVLRLVSICLDAGENGTAVVQEDGAFFMYGSEEGMGLPEFSCTGAIRTAETVSAAAYWLYNCEELPIVRVPDGQEFTADMLPDAVLSVVNRDYTECEEEVPVVWDDTTFPDKHQRTLVQGKFAEGYSQFGDYMPVCLVVWESDTYPFFLNVYTESATQWYDMVFMYGEAPLPGTVYIQASDTGEDWKDISGTEGYSPVETEGNDSFFWLLSYDKTEPGGERPRYYRLFQILDDGTELYSEAVSLSGQYIFTGADIEGGRGGELSPGEGENQLPDFTAEEEDTDKIAEPGSQDVSSESETFITPEDATAYKASLKIDSASFSDGASADAQPQGQTAQDAGSSEESPAQDADSPKVNGAQEGADTGEDASVKTKAEQPEDTGAIEKLTGVAIVICILLCAVGFFVYNRKK